MFAVDRNGEAARILQNVSAGADHLAGVRPRESTLGSWAEFLVSRYDRRVARAAEKAPPLIDLYRSFYGPDAPPLQASEFAQQLTRVIRYVRALFSIAHDVHAHPEGYDARKGIYYTRLMQMAGRYSEVLGCGIPQGCGVGHYTNPNSPPLSYRGAAVLDARHLGEHQTLRSNYVKWADYMRQVANNDPALAVRIDQAAFMGDLDTVNSLVDGAPRHFAFYRESIKSLAQKEPHLALNAHYATTGFNPADPASGRYVLDMNVDHYYEVSGAGETTLQKENVNRQLQFIGENFDFENPAHIASAVRWLAVQKVMGKIMSIHSDWGIARMGENGSLVGTTDHGYTMFDPLLDLVSPFAQSSDSSVILDHAGGGRYVNYDPTPMTVPDWLADAGYGDTIPHQILKMEEARHRAPGVKFDISWNDNGIQFTTNGDLRAGLIRFMQRHPDAVLFGTDTVKPVNRSQYLQNLTTLTDFFIELGAVDRQLALNALRHNFERLADRSFAKTLDATTLRNLAGQLDDIARSVETPDSEPMRNLFGRMGQEHASAAAADIRGYAQVLRDKADAVGSKGVPGRDAADLIHNGVVVNGRDGQPHTITTGRSHMRGSAQHLYHGIEFEWIARTFIYDRLSGALGNLAPQGGAEIAPQPQNLPVRGGRSRTPDLSHPQTGTGAGAPWMEQGAARWMMLSDAAITAAGAAAGLIPFAGPIAGGARAGLFGRGLYRQEFSRRLWESIFEDGRGLGVSLFAHEVVKAGREMGIPESRLAEFVKSMMQMDVDADYVYTETAAWARANDPENLGVERVDWSKGDLPLAHHALMAVIGIGQISGDQALGVQASSLLHLDPRTRKGRRHNIYISATSAASGTGAWATTAATVAVLPPGVPQIAAAIAGTAFSLVVSGTQGMMIWQRIWANRFGRGNLNPELNDRFRHLQTRILEGIQAGGVAGAGNALTLGVLANGNLALMGVNVVLDLGVAWTADRARRIERARVGLEGGTDPTPSAKALERVLQALGLDAGAAAASNANPDAVKAWLDALEKGLDSLGW